MTIDDLGYGWWLPPGVRERTVEGLLSISSVDGPEDELARIGVADPKVAVFDLALPLRGGGALPWPVYGPSVILLGAALIAAGVWAKWSLYRPRLSGTAILRFASAPGAPWDTEEKVLFEGRAIQSQALAHPGGVWTLTLQARKKRGKTLTVAVPGEGVTTVRGKELRSEFEVRSKTCRFESQWGEIQLFLS